MPGDAGPGAGIPRRTPGELYVIEVHRVRRVCLRSKKIKTYACCPDLEFEAPLRSHGLLQLLENGGGELGGEIIGGTPLRDAESGASF
jgi:hypothetical protein